MFNERTPLHREHQNGYTSHFERYNKTGIVNCLSCAILVILASAFIIFASVYFEMEDKLLHPLSEETNDSFALSLNFINKDGLDINVQKDKIYEAFKLAKLDLKHKETLDRENPTIKLNSPSYKHQQVLKGENGSYSYAKKGYLINRAMNHLIRNHPDEGPAMYDISTPDWLKLEFCNKDEQECDFSYRKINGYCNNKKHSTLWGVAMRPFARVLPADYCDGIGTPRCSKDKTPLPSSRLVSIKLHRPEYRNDPTFTYMFAVWGQFIDHDITSTALNKGVDGQFLSCCGGVNHPECYPANISSDDPYYSKFGINCMEFVRSAPAPTCKLGSREQLNQVTSYLDGSAVYGSIEELANDLRDFSGGRLRMFYTKDGRELLPISTDFKDGCNREEEAKKGRYCFLAGDSRANENLHLTSIHLIMTRQHNRLALDLSKLNPDWDDEKLYQESRRIVIAQMQHITFNEFLKPLLGEEIMEKYRLNLENYEYNANIDASMNNNFAAAAFRFAHTLLPKLMKIAANNTMSPELVLLHKMLFNPFRLYDVGSLDSVIYSAVNTRADKLDRFFNTETTRHLFQDARNTTENKTCGLDLVTLNLQRGRDHGLPGYTKWRKYCSLSDVKSFSDLQDIMDSDSITVLKKYYKDVEDIDLYSGALSEAPLENAILGPTATCLIAKQFHKIKFGDRYWYEITEKPQGFTKEQLKELKKTTLAKIICDNSDSLQFIREYVMEIMEDINDQIECDSFDKMDLQFWSDSQKSLGQFQSSGKSNGTKPSIVKLYASTTLITGEIFGSYDNNEPVKLFDGTLPAEIYVNNFTDPNGYDVSAKIEWEGVATNNTLMGTFSLPVVINHNLNPEVKFWKGNFTVVVAYKWGGSLEIVEPRKTYRCKLMFTAFSKKATVTLKGKTIKDPESCTIMLAGSFYKKPFYCALTPWWCTNEKIYYWSGNTELIIRKPATNVTVLEETKYEAPQKHGVNKVYLAQNLEDHKSEKAKLTNYYTSMTLIGDGNQTMHQIVNLSDKDKPTKPVLIKRYVSATIVGGAIFGSYEEGEMIKLFNGQLPASIYYENFTDPYNFDVRANITWKGTFSNNSLSGTFILPVMIGEDPNKLTKYWRGNFILNIDYLQDDLNIIKSKENYRCKLIFTMFEQPVLKENSVEGDENCVIMVAGWFYKQPFYCYLTPWWCTNDKIYSWSGGVELVLENPTVVNNQLISGYSPFNHNYKKYDLYRNTFINVHAHTIEGIVSSGWVKVYRPNGPELWTGSWPVEIQLPLYWESDPALDNLHNNYSHGISFSCSIFQSSIKGSFRLPKYTKYGLIEWAVGKFSFEITPIHEGTMYDMLIPDVEYYSSIHFHDIDRKMSIVPQDYDKLTAGKEKMNMSIIILGTYNDGLRNTFTWNGDFFIIIDKIPYMHRLI